MFISSAATDSAVFDIQTRRAIQLITAKIRIAAVTLTFPRCERIEQHGGEDVHEAGSRNARLAPAAPSDPSGRGR